MIQYPLSPEKYPLIIKAIGNRKAHLHVRCEYYFEQYLVLEEYNRI